MQSARCFWSRKFDFDVYYESEADIPPDLANKNVTILECPSNEWQRFLPTRAMFALCDSYVTQYVKGGTKKAVTNHRKRGGVMVGNHQPTHPPTPLLYARLHRLASLGPCHRTPAPLTPAPPSLRVHQDDGASGEASQYAHVSSSQQDVYYGDGEDESLFAKVRSSTLISKEEREKMVARDEQFFHDLFRLTRGRIGKQRMVALELKRSKPDEQVEAYD